MVTLGYITAALTVVLILVTAFYATANWRTMRLVEADLRLRSQPIPSVKSLRGFGNADGSLTLEYHILVSNAPLVLDAAFITATIGGTRQICAGEHYDPPKTVGVGIDYVYSPTIKRNSKGDSIEKPQLSMEYSDLAGLFGYISEFGPDNQERTHRKYSGSGWSRAITKIVAVFKAVDRFGNP
jgi:hypothetical protein